MGPTPRDTLLLYPCKIYADDDPNPAPVERRKSLARWFQEGYDTPRGDCNGLGLSIWSRSDQASHRGYPLLNPALTAIKALERAMERSDSHPDMRSDVLEALEIVHNAARTRLVSFY